ncbi:Endolysin [Comamonas aquatilis]|uniref:glycoside hydrolase family 24 protein n=1 Tax=Comamonas aquatilis TaxID=1778406 RepID=UPI0039F0D394
MTAITAGHAGGKNVLAWGEGTDNGRQPIRDRGYDVLVGGGQFSGYADHPRQLIDLPRLKIKSTAAGRYQLLSRYFDAYKRLLGLKDFSPLSQDLIAIQQIRERRALPFGLASCRHPCSAGGAVMSGAIQTITGAGQAPVTMSSREIGCRHSVCWRC